MSDLDDLAAAASGGGTRGRQPAIPPTKPVKTGKSAKPAKPAKPQALISPADDEGSIAYEQPVPSAGLSPMTWVGLGAGIVVVLALAFWLVNRDRNPAPEPIAQAGRTAGARGATTKAIASATGPTTTAGQSPGALGGASAAGSGAAAKAASRPAPVVLKDIEEPTEAVEVLPITRDGDVVNIRVRNISRRGVYVKVLQFYAESDDKKPIGESIRFWVAAGGTLVAPHKMPDISDRLGEDEGVVALVEEAEFADTMPEEPAATTDDEDAEGAAEADDNEEVQKPAAPPKSKKGKKKTAKNE